MLLRDKLHGKDDMKLRSAIVVPLMMLAIAAVALPARSQTLHLIPQPREVKTQSGEFRLDSKTRIVVIRKYAGQDLAAAQMLQDEIQRITGRKPKIHFERSMPGWHDMIFLGRAGRDRRLDHLLRVRGLSIGPGFNAQGYVLDAQPRRIVVAASTGQGLFYGVQTLRQLLGQDTKEPAACPAVTIRDWPAMGWRGVQDDLSRGPIPTLAYMERQIRTLAGYKINLFGLYMENVYDFKSQPLIAPKGAALSAEDIKKLVDYGHRYYVTILPEQEAFGHLHKVLRLAMYSKLAETPHGGVLSPVQPGSFTLIKSMLTELAPLFPGPFFHIGADETSELGEGQTKELAEKEGLGAVYLSFLTRIDQMLEPYHKRIMFWGDIAMKYPQLLNTLPKNMIAVAWNYSDADSFDKMLEPYKNAGLKTFVSPGANNWNRIYPDLDAAFLNIRNFVRDGQKFGSMGMLNTMWNDDGESLPDMAWPALVYGAACSWQPGQSSRKAFWASYDWAFYRASGHHFAGAIQKLANVNQLLDDAGLGGTNDKNFWLDPFSEPGARFAQQALPQTHQARMDAEEALATLYRQQADAHLHQETLGDLIFAAKRLDTLGLKIQYTAEISDLYHNAYLNMGNPKDAFRDLYRISATNGRLEDLRDLTTRLETEYAHLWHEQYQPFWLGNVLIRYNTLASLYQSKIQKMDVVIAQYRQTSEIPPPQQMGFVFQQAKNGSGKKQ
jgi:hexosaminidase